MTLEPKTTFASIAPSDQGLFWNVKASDPGMPNPAGHRWFCGDFLPKKYGKIWSLDGILKRQWSFHRKFPSMILSCYPFIIIYMDTTHMTDHGHFHFISFFPFIYLQNRDIQIYPVMAAEIQGSSWSTLPICWTSGSCIISATSSWVPLVRLQLGESEVFVDRILLREWRLGHWPEKSGKVGKSREKSGKVGKVGKSLEKSGKSLEKSGKVWKTGGLVD